MKLSEQLTGVQEDKIFRFRQLIQEFGRIQDLYFEELKEKTGIRGGREEDFLFDYCYNSGTEESFAEYLSKLNS